MLYSSKVSKWLEDGRLVRGGGATNWKRQYKLRHKWSKGSCKRTETEIAQYPSIPPVLVRLHEGVIVTADSTAGIRAWSMQDDERLIASMAWGVDGHSVLVPSSLDIDISSTDTADLSVSVGFFDGSFGIFALDRRKRSLACRYMHAPSTNGTVTAMAFAFPYILTMTEAQLLSLYAFSANEDERLHRTMLDPPRLLSSLRSYTARPPLSLAIRCSSAGISTSIAYGMPTLTTGWSVGLQELRLTDEGKTLESRLATPFNGGYVPLMPSDRRNGARFGESDESVPYTSWHARSSVVDVFRHWSPSSSANLTSLSYNHPYLLTAHSDNTMTLYMVTSNDQELSIGPGRQLWGHTSAVSGAHVGDRGKAVSVSTHSNDLRVWELEGGVLSSISRRRTDSGAALSVAIRPSHREGATPGEEPQTKSGTKSTEQKDIDEAMISKGWLSFDEEQVVLLGEKSRGAQALVVYNFA